MKKILMGMAMLLSLGVSGQAFADRPSEIPGTYRLRQVGTTQTGDGTIVSGRGTKVAMVIVACNGTACTATLADTTAPGLAGDYGGDTVVRLEAGGGATQPGVLDLTESPINFDNGIIFNDDGNVTGVSVYEWAP